jgi:hypothetical protein
VEELLDMSALGSGHHVRKIGTVPPTGRRELSFIVRVCYNISTTSLCLRPKSHLDLSIFYYNNLMTPRKQHAHGGMHRTMHTISSTDLTGGGGSCGID